MAMVCSQRPKPARFGRVAAVAAVQLIDCTALGGRGPDEFWAAAIEGGAGLSISASTVTIATARSLVGAAA